MKLHLPSGLERGLAFLIQDDWTPAQACAVVELLDDLREVICSHYQQQIQQYLQDDRTEYTRSTDFTLDDEDLF
jgi:demethoxyubiquinone hydroxylase (CLK1/Coq7/Cat5 family)